MPEPHSFDAATGTPYVPPDYEGDIVACGSCGNPAPHPRGLTPSPVPECTPCFIGRVANEIVTLSEATMLKSEITRWEKP